MSYNDEDYSYYEFHISRKSLSIRYCTSGAYFVLPNIFFEIPEKQHETYYSESWWWMDIRLRHLLS